MAALDAGGGGIDLSQEESLTALKQRLDGTSLDVVILNAEFCNLWADDLDPEGIRRQFEVNALAPLLLTRVLMNQMAPGSRLALMTSRMGSIDDNTSGGSYGYRMSKVALNIAGKSLAVDLKARGIAVAILHPGLVRTRMIQFNPSGISPAQSVRGLLARIDALTLETTGTFWHANGDILLVNWNAGVCTDADRFVEIQNIDGNVVPQRPRRGGLDKPPGWFRVC